MEWCRDKCSLLECVRSLVRAPGESYQRQKHDVCCFSAEQEQRLVDTMIMCVGVMSICIFLFQCGNTHTLNGILSLLAHWNNIHFHSDTISFLRADLSLSLVLSVVCLVEKKNGCCRSNGVILLAFLFHDFCS